MNWIRDFYKTSALASNGIFLLVALVVLLVLGQLFTPKFKSSPVNKQLYTVKGTHLKYNDEPYVSDFFNSIRKNDGYLIMGTSETTNIPDGNYFDFLNADSTIKEQFSVLGGAGRTCGIYIPVFLANKEYVRGLKIIYYINPGYWGHNLSTVQKAYWGRYSNYGLAKDVELTNEQLVKYYEPVQGYFDKLNFFEKQAFGLEYQLRSLKYMYFNDLRLKLFPEEYERELVFVPARKSDLNEFRNFGQIDVEQIDTIINTKYSFHNPEWFASIDLKADYRYKELSAFVDLCTDLGIEATFVVGPYNERFIKDYAPGSLSPYIDVTDNIKTLLEEKGIDYVDASIISNEPGIFRDVAHHSSYGAYLIYQQIKEHLKDDKASL